MCIHFVTIKISFAICVVQPQGLLPHKHLKRKN
jgi:hypothetical protein